MKWLRKGTPITTGEEAKEGEPKSKDKLTYMVPQEKRGCDKGGHKERSLKNQPNYRKHKK